MHGQGLISAAPEAVVGQGRIKTFASTLFGARHGRRDTLGEAGGSVQVPAIDANCPTDCHYDHPHRAACAPGRRCPQVATATASLEPLQP